MDLVHCPPPLGHLSKNGVLSLYLPRSWINDADNQQRAATQRITNEELQS